MPASADGGWSYMHTDGRYSVVRVTVTHFTDTGKTATGYNENSQAIFTPDPSLERFYKDYAAWEALRRATFRATTESI